MQPKFMVVSLGKIIKVVVGVLVGAGIIFAVINLFGGGESKATYVSKATYAPGTYTAEIILQGSPINVEVTVSRNQIENVALSNLNQSQEVFYPSFSSCIAEVSKEVVANQSTDFPRSSAYPVSEDIILQAVDKALAQAKK